MFFLNLGYHWLVPELGNYGVCIGAYGVNAQSALTGDRRSRLPTRVIFDPQLYLRDLNDSDCEPVVKRLATYPWFNPSAPEREEGQSIRDWKNQVFEDSKWPCPLPDDPTAIYEIVKTCLDFQIEFGVNGLIIPAPMTRDPEGDFSCEARWIDQGLVAVPKGNSLPIYATLAISDRCLIHRNPDESELLDTIVDQIAARTELDGVYIVLEQIVPSDSNYLTNPRVAWALLRLCYDLGKRASLRIIVNYVDAFGLACLAAGAEGFCAGPTQKGRRLCLNDFETRGGGVAFPRFYAHSLVLNLLPERDIEEKIASKRLLRLLQAEETTHSISLFEALRAEQKIEQVGEWQERPNNVTASHHQYIERIIQATEELMASEDKNSDILAWLQDAERNTDYLAERFDDNPLSADHRHVSAWRSAFENFLEQYEL